MNENDKQAEPVASQTRHPIQPLKADKEGVVRFKENSIVRFLTEGKLNELAVMGFPREEWVQLAQLIGYSLSGWGTLSYVSDEDWERANQNHPAQPVQGSELSKPESGFHNCTFTPAPTERGVIVSSVECEAQPVQHPDEVAVDKFAAAMKEKLALARAKGRGGWEQMNPTELSTMLYEHVEKGDPRDVANFCMFLWNLGQPIAQCHKAPAAAINEQMLEALNRLQNAGLKVLGGEVGVYDLGDLGEALDFSEAAIAAAKAEKAKGDV